MALPLEDFLRRSYADWLHKQAPEVAVVAGLMDDQAFAVWVRERVTFMGGLWGREALRWADGVLGLSETPAGPFVVQIMSPDGDLDLDRVRDPVESRNDGRSKAGLT